jgi:MFS family permease
MTKHDPEVKAENAKTYSLIEFPMPSSLPRPANRPPDSFAALAPFFLSSFAWNVALGMTFILIPLYARSLGMSGLQIGTLIALPVVLHIAFTLVGGAYTDRVGGKNMSLASCAFTSIAALLFMASSGFALMLAAQFLMVMARATFWTANLSLASELPGSPGKQMGRFTAATNAGQILGTTAAGFIIAGAGFRFGFGVMAAAGLAALVLNQMYRTAASVPRKSKTTVFGTYRQLIGMRTIRFSMMCAYISALPTSLAVSFYPILLVEQGLDLNSTGTIISVRAVGAIAAGFVAGYFIKQVRGLSAPLGSAIIVGISVALAAAVSQPVLIALFMFGLGVGSAAMGVYTQMLIGQVSSKETRGSAMALYNVGWGISLLTTPFAMGIFQDFIGIRAAFYIMGGFTLVCGLLLIPAQRWAFAPEPVKATNPA